jgi:hypothetical protein
MQVFCVRGGLFSFVHSEVYEKDITMIVQVDRELIFGFSFTENSK